MEIIVEQTSLTPPAVHRLGDDMVDFYIVEELSPAVEEARRVGIT